MFARHSRVMVTLTEKNTYDELVEAIRAIEWWEGGTYTFFGLKDLRETVMVDARTDLPRYELYINITPYKVIEFVT